MSTVLVIDCVHNDLPDDLLAHSTYGLDALLHDSIVGFESHSLLSIGFAQF